MNLFPEQLYLRKGGRGKVKDFVYKYIHRHARSDAYINVFCVLLSQPTPCLVRPKFPGVGWHAGCQIQDAGCTCCAHYASHCGSKVGEGMVRLEFQL